MNTAPIAQGPVDVNVSCSWWQCRVCGDDIGLLGRMLSWLPFGHRCAAAPALETTAIAAGQQWCLSSSVEDSGPWAPTKPPRPVTILDARDGWVRYSFGRNGPLDDCRMRESMFRSVYRPMNG